MNIDNIKCVTMGEKQYVLTNTFDDIFASVLGTDSNKQDRPVCYEDLLISLLKLLGKLVQTPITFNNSSVSLNGKREGSKMCNGYTVTEFKCGNWYILVLLVLIPDFYSSLYKLERK